MKFLLKVENLSMNFGGVHALQEINFSISSGEIVALIGPNGAGKTTLFNCVTGICRPTTGNVYFKDKEGDVECISKKRSYLINRKGLARTFQNIRLFHSMTVLENIILGRHFHLHSGIFGAILRPKKTRDEEKQLLEDSYNILERFGLAQYVNAPAVSLSYGNQRRLEIARAVATEPQLLLLDEPAAGLNPTETQELDDLILRIRDQEKLTILLIEHDMKLVMSLSERICVMDYGKIIAEGSPEEIRRDPVVIEAYLGEETNVAG